VRNAQALSIPYQRLRTQARASNTDANRRRGTRPVKAGAYRILSGRTRLRRHMKRPSRASAQEPASRVIGPRYI
jgi:hypothetical protein